MDLTPSSLIVAGGAEYFLLSARKVGAWATGASRMTEAGGEAGSLAVLTVETEETDE